MGTDLDYSQDTEKTRPLPERLSPALGSVIYEKGDIRPL